MSERQRYIKQEEVEEYKRRQYNTEEAGYRSTAYLPGQYFKGNRPMRRGWGGQPQRVEAHPTAFAAKPSRG